jgi:ABC-type nitrate/sulfonate/bicarbonate transport system substrate-binding protein
VWFTTADWVTKHPVAARSFVTAMRETAAWANHHRHESALILAKYMKVEPERIESIARVTYGDHVTPDLIQPDIDAAVRYGVLKTPFPAGDLITIL